MAICSKLLPLALLGVKAMSQSTAAHSDPPEGSEPLSWGWYATPEIQEPTELEISGTIPSWISGSLYRGAAGTWDAGNYTARHWFDGFDRAHRFEISDGSVTYRSRNGSDELYDFVAERGLYPGGSFGSDPCKVIFGEFETEFRDGENLKGDKSTNAVGVSWIPNFPGLDVNTTSNQTGSPFDTIVITTDANQLHQIDPVTLEPIELFTYQASNPLLKNNAFTAAHPIIDSDGTVFNYILDFEAEPPVYRIFTIQAPEGEARIIANITDAPPAYIHSMFATEKHIIFIVWQADYVKRGVNILDSIGEWDPKRKSLFYVIDRSHDGIVTKYVSPDAFFAFHEINSFENDDGDIFVDIARLNDTNFLQALKLENLRSSLGNVYVTYSPDVPGVFARYKLPHPRSAQDAIGFNESTIATKKAELEFTLPADRAGIELPRINSVYQGKPYRYAYGIHLETKGWFADSIIKVDTEQEDWKIWTPETRHLPSEPVFVRRPGATREDDGVLLLVAMDSEEKKSSLVVLDAETMTEVARAKMPIVMGYGFHGVWGRGG